MIGQRPLTSFRNATKPVLFAFCAVCLSALMAGGAAAAATVEVQPYPVQAGQPLQIKYDPTGRVLENTPQVYLHHGVNAWSTVASPDPVMTWDSGKGVWEITVEVAATAYQFDLVFNDGAGTWDNNNGADWHYFALGATANTWNIDGELDEGAVVVGESNGRQLYAGVRGTTLYVAAPPAIQGNDHFIFIADTPGAPRIAPWDKVGQVADWAAYIGNEADNGWVGWFETDGASDLAIGSWIEATLDLEGEFGVVPTIVHLAFATYGTAVGDALLPATQIPVSGDGDGDIDAAEYLAINVADITVGCGRLDFDKDCDVDEDDAAFFTLCVGGPGVSVAGAACSTADLDEDADVDLIDFAAFQIELGAPADDTAVGEDLGGGVVRYYPASVTLADLPPSMSLAIEPTVQGSAPADDLTPYFFQSGSRFGAVIDIPDGTSLYGTGEIAGPLLRNGRSTEAWNSDNYAYGEHNASLYQSHPWVLGVRPDGTAFGLLADTTYRCRIDLTTEVLFAAEGPRFPVYVFEGETPQAVIERLTEYTGRIEMPPLWALGYQQCRYSYSPDYVAQGIANGFRNRDIPCDVIWFDIDYMNQFRIFTFHPVNFSNPWMLNSNLHGQGFHTVWMINPAPALDPGYFVYDQGTLGNHWVLDAQGFPYQGEVWPGPVHYPDFTRPETRAWWAGLYADFMAMGVDGVWNDMNEPVDFAGPYNTLSLSCQHRGGGGLPAGTHRQYHNVYGMLMVQASREGIMAANPDKRPFVLSRANFIGGNRFAAMWTGDNIASWQHLYYSTPMVLNMGLSGQPFAGPDIGGFVGDGSGEMFARWMGVGAFMPFCRAHSDNQGVDKEPWSFGAAVEVACRTALQRRYRLLPYIYTLFHEASETGLPVMRPVFFADPADLSLRDEDVAFLLGADLLVVPNVAENPFDADTPDLPSGVWRTLSLVGENSSADVNQPDLRLRGGAILPLGPVMEYTGQKVLDPLTLVISLDDAGEAEGWLYEDDGDGWDFQTGDYRLARYTATRSGDVVTVEVAEVQGQRPTPMRAVTIQVVTDGGVFTGAGVDVAAGVVGTVGL